MARRRPVTFKTEYGKVTFLAKIKKAKPVLLVQRKKQKEGLML